jgi:6-pyruvoyltetrahydropterin/6-carboxytetrahydropterin synthase
VFEVAYETTFCATHLLHDGGRPLEPNHGHDWRVEVVAAGETLDRIGVVVDFEHLKQAVAEVARRFHYADITSHPDFAGQSPSAEAVARYFFAEVKKAMGPEGERLRRVRAWEAPGCSATYLG